MLFGEDKNLNLSGSSGRGNALSEDRRNEADRSGVLSLNNATHDRLKEIVLPMLYSLLSSKESESKAGGLNILGSFCGLSYDFTGVKIHQNLHFLQRNSQFVSLPIWRLVYQLQDDWDITIKEASVVLVQLCAPRNAIMYYQSLKAKREKQKLEYMQSEMPSVKDIHSAGEDTIQGQLKKQIRPASALKLKNYLVNKNKYAARAIFQFPSEQDRDMILEKGWGHEQSFSRHSVDLGMGDQITFADYLSGRMLQPLTDHVTCQMIEQENQALIETVHAFNPSYEDVRLSKAPLSRKRQLEIELDLRKPASAGKAKATKNGELNFFVDSYADEQIQEIISIFRNDFKPPKNLWIEKQPSPYALGSGGAHNAGGPNQQ